MDKYSLAKLVQWSGSGGAVAKGAKALQKSRVLPPAGRVPFWCEVHLATTTAQIPETLPKRAMSWLPLVSSTKRLRDE